LTFLASFCIFLLKIDVFSFETGDTDGGTAQTVQGQVRTTEPSDEAGSVTRLLP